MVAARLAMPTQKRSTYCACFQIPTRNKISSAAQGTAEGTAMTAGAKGQQAATGVVDSPGGSAAVSAAALAVEGSAAAPAEEDSAAA